MSTRAQIITKVNAIFKRDDKATEVIDALNEAYFEMLGVIQYHKTSAQKWVNLVQGREEYAIPSDTLRINHPIRLIELTAQSDSGSSYNMDFITKDEYDALEPNPNVTPASLVSTGKPTKYTVWKNCILLTPIPDSSTLYKIELNLGGEVAKLAADADIPVFSERWEETLKAGTLARLFALIELYERASYWQGIYINGYAGADGYFNGGLKLLKEISNNIDRAPHIVKNRDF